MIEGSNYQIQPTPLHQETEEKTTEGTYCTQSLIDDFLNSSVDSGTLMPGETYGTLTPPPTMPLSFCKWMMQNLQHPNENSRSIPTKFGNDQRLYRKQARSHTTTGKSGIYPRNSYRKHSRRSCRRRLSDHDFSQNLHQTAAILKRLSQIIRKVNLNNPKKSSYFADQIRFLQKLIVNKKHQK